MRRFYERGGWVLMLPLMIPLTFLLMFALLVIVVAWGVWAAMRWLYHQWPRHRRALRLARQTLNERMPGRLVSDWRIARRERGKVFVQATLLGNIDPPNQWLCAVMDGEERLDDVGTWRFQHGVNSKHAVRAYEAAQVNGEAWPTSTLELIERLPEQERPKQARPGLHPHRGTIVVRLSDGFHFFYTTDMGAADYLQTVETEFMEVCDAECRHITFRRAEPLAEPPLYAEILAPIPANPPDKVFIERLRHHLIGRAEASSHDRLQSMTASELVEFGLERNGDGDDVMEGEVE